MTNLKERLFTRTVKTWLWGIFVGLLFGSYFGRAVESGRVYQDCRIMGSVRVGEAAFKCEQFSKAVLLMPEEGGKNVSKTNE